MCRLFGLSADPHRVHARFWLLEAPDSLAEQSRKNPDGTGLGFFDPEGKPVLDKQAIAAFEDAAFAREARHLSSTTFVSHVRWATTGVVAPENTHPFAMAGRIMAHNGAIGDLPALEAELGEAMAPVQGKTDSERIFALVTRETERNGGDVGAGITSAVGWIADNLPVFAVNIILATPHELWALRYPETHRLAVLERAAGGPHGYRPLHHSSDTLRVHAAELKERPCVVVASEHLDDSADWRELEVGELLHVDADLTVTSRIAIDRPPAHLLTRAQIAPAGGANPAH
jgi:glutamine amidotransferase